jgi:protein-tyrosine-phosphatase
MPSSKPSVLFVCVRNAARSQMSEAFTKSLCPGDFAVESAGLGAEEDNCEARDIVVIKS